MSPPNDQLPAIIEPTPVPISAPTDTYLVPALIAELGGQADWRINRSVLLAMDFFVVPMSIDVFSSWAIRNIGTTVEIWQKELRTGIFLAEDPAELESIDRTRAIKFLGYVTQQHRERIEEEFATPIVVESDDTSDVRRRRIVQAYEEISEKFPEQIAESLGRFLDSVQIDPFLGNVRHLGSLAPKSQSQHSPMISVRGTGRFVQSRKQVREIYREIAARYLENLSQF